MQQVVAEKSGTGEKALSLYSNQPLRCALRPLGADIRARPEAPEHSGTRCEADRLHTNADIQGNQEQDGERRREEMSTDEPHAGEIRASVAHAASKLQQSRESLSSLWASPC
ncbi:hypothetical protein SKAU_G00045080 [Synaphobranchus kaupii]|uniref:Uncharacterized protein n=1 Tax=Synaphobranchus kaupii TaxID=118154 RepID=A0A9Q1G1V0_SYNKA|nr:hypothetical protein SKAU_G00045080 [Synaphobranchus kaupii]